MQDEAAAAGLLDFFGGVPANKRRGLPFESLDVSDNELGDGQIADEVIAALEQLADRPFFLAVGFLRPHLPFVASQRYWDLYDPEKLPSYDPAVERGGLPGLSANNSHELRGQYQGVPAWGPFPEELNRNLWHGYLACVSYVDAQIGRVLDALERLDLTSRTIVVVAGDHGFHMGEIGLWSKATNFEAATRTPLIIHVPANTVSGTKSDTIVERVDLYPTLCDLAGLPKPEHLQGDSFAALLSDPASRITQEALSQYPRGNAMGRAIRTPRYRLVEWRDRKSGELLGRELYDHEQDDSEATNVADSPKYTQVVRSFREIAGCHPPVSLSTLEIEETFRERSLKACRCWYNVPMSAVHPGPKGAVPMSRHRTASQSMTKAQRIFLDLRSKILSGELASDLRLTLRPIAAEYGTGINAASEAIKALSMEGLVQLEGKGGARVIARDLNRIRGEFILRIAIECEAVRQAARQIDDSQLSILRRIAEKVDSLFEEGDSLSECRRLDVKFHLTLADFSGIPQLKDALAPLLTRLVVLDQTANRTSEIPGQKHMEVFEGIETGDPDKAVQAMRQHLEHSMNLSLVMLHDDNELNGREDRLHLTDTM